MTSTYPMIDQTVARRVELATRVVVAYLFLLYSRSFEFLISHHVPDLRYMLLISLVALVMVAAQGRLGPALTTPLGYVLAAWTVWMMLALPFSTWKGESLNKFVNVWLKSMCAYIIVVGLTRTYDDLRRVFRAFGWGAAFAVFSVWGVQINDGRLSGVGSLGNANELAFHMLWGVPFLVLLIYEKKGAIKFFLIPFVPALFYLALKTVSRSGLIMQAIIGALTFFRVSMANRAKMIVLGILVAIVGVSSLSEEAKLRYLTTFSSNVNSADPTVASAVLSAETRKQKMREGVELTLQHPLFGVGMGAFQPASTTLEKERGLQPIWLEAHDSYVQVSSETGIPGFLCLVTLVVYPLVQLIKLDRKAKAKGRNDLRGYAFALILMVVLLMVQLFFDAMGYLSYTPLMCGLTTVFLKTTRPMLEDAAEGAVEPAVESGRQAAVFADRQEPVLAGAARRLTPIHRTPQREMPQAAASPGRANPYRFGRRRVEAPSRAITDRT